MSTQESNPPSLKLPLVALFVFAFTIVGTGTALFYLGTFRQPALEKVMTPGYRMVYVNNTGPYSEIKYVFKEIEARLKGANITFIAASALFLDDPSMVASDKLRSKVGYLINDHERSPPDFNDERLLSQEVIQATFDGSPLIGSYKAYTAMRQWSADNHYQLNLPSLEIYYPDGRVVYQLPISLKAK